MASFKLIDKKPLQDDRN